MGKFLIPYSHSLLSLFISMTIIQIYDEKGILKESYFLFYESFIAMTQMLAATLIVGVPVVLVGCLLERYCLGALFYL